MLSYRWLLTRARPAGTRLIASFACRAVAFAVLWGLAIGLLFLGPLPSWAQEGGGSRMQGLPPAPPPSGIQPSPPRTPDARPGPAARRAAAKAFGTRLVVEVHGLERGEADAALRAAVEAVREAEGLLAPDGDPALGGVAAINAASGAEPIAVDPRLAGALERTLSFCTWTDRAHGPLGGRLYQLWGLRDPVSGRPTPEQLQVAARAAACDRLATETTEDGARAQLANGSRLDLWGFALGLAVDHAMETLQKQGVDDAFVELGPVRRAMGPGVDGRGWPVTLPVFPGQPAPLDRVWLQDDALAVASAVHRPLLVGGDTYAPWIDQRSGLPATGVLGVVTVSELAVDAEALAGSLFILGNREGLMRMGALRPDPHVLWLLGSGGGQPVMTQHNWTEISRR